MIHLFITKCSSICISNLRSWESRRWGHSAELWRSWAWRGGVWTPVPDRRKNNWLTSVLQEEPKEPYIELSSRGRLERQVSWELPVDTNIAKHALLKGLTLKMGKVRGDLIEVPCPPVPQRWSWERPSLKGRLVISWKHLDFLLN